MLLVPALLPLLLSASALVPGSAALRCLCGIHNVGPDSPYPGSSEPCPDVGLGQPLFNGSLAASDGAADADSEGVLVTLEAYGDREPVSVRMDVCHTDGACFKSKHLGRKKERKAGRNSKDSRNSLEHT